MAQIQSPGGASTALYMLNMTARASAAGADASVDSLLIGEGERRETDVNKLLATENQIERDRFDRIGDMSRKTDVDHLREQREAQATKRTVERIEKRMRQMMGALSRLGAGPGHEGMRILGLFGTEGSDAIAITGAAVVNNVNTEGGNDSFSASAKVVTGVHTGAGHDAVTIKADSVDGIYTDVGERSVFVDGKTYDDPDIVHSQIKGARLVVHREKHFVGNDAVAIEAKRANSIYTGGGHDAVAISADIVKSVYAGEGHDAVSIKGGIVSGIHGQEGNDSITVKAIIGDSVRRSLSSDVDGGWIPGKDVTYERPGDVKERMALAISNYADVLGGFGNDAINVTVQEMISVEGGAGDDVIHVGGGTVGLRIGSNSGHDHVTVAEGAEVVLQLDAGHYQTQIDGADLVVSFAGGSVRIADFEKAGAIGIGSWGSQHAPHGREPSQLQKDLAQAASEATKIDIPITAPDAALAEAIGPLRTPLNGIEMLHFAPPAGLDKSA